jgi:hypothetical protein
MYTSGNGILGFLDCNCWYLFPHIRARVYTPKQVCAHQGSPAKGISEKINFQMTVAPWQTQVNPRRTAKLSETAMNICKARGCRGALYATRRCGIRGRKRLGRGHAQKSRSRRYLVANKTSNCFLSNQECHFGWQAPSPGSDKPSCERFLDF